MVTTPDGMPVAMVHSQNCTSDLNAWVNLFRENLESFGVKVDTNTLYGTLYNKALEGDADCGGLLPYCYFSGEHITHFEEGRPLFARTPDSKFTLANFMRSHLFTSVGALKLGMDILLKEEGSWARWFLQDKRCGTESDGGSGQCAGIRDGNSRRRRCLGNRSSGCLP